MDIKYRPDSLGGILGPKTEVDFCEVILRYNPIHLDSKTLNLIEWELKECISKLSLPIRLRLERFV